ncbi:C45 family autoproteolytic acyltransferase/hydolase [Falsibacillus albus]|uniref:Peptidase C45 n=1 Tax=Falsibacillus albus TaxID=2478915 RepID=A0A3L7JNN2_9BACI|nr:C45 family peptidase [Falsibacillus albus]RLQ92393.1 peptidase C45 [Falsibacillus albus]
MADFKVEIVQLRSDPFHIGFELGRFLKGKSTQNHWMNLTKQQINLENMRSVFLAYSPHLLDELHGLAEGIELTFESAASLFSGYGVPRFEAMGCSAFMTRDGYIRNYDFSPEYYDGIFSLVQSRDHYASAGYNLQILGRHDGVNEKGLAIGLHFVNNEGHREGVSAWTVVRMVLDMCANVDEAAQLIKELPHACCYNFSLADASGKNLVVEAGPAKTVVRGREVNSSCVNHFNTEEMKRMNRDGIEGSIKREKFLSHYGDGKTVTTEEMFNLFRDPESPMFFTDYEQFFGTLHTIAYSRKDARLMTAAARGKVLDINFQDWVNGENLNEVELVGEITSKDDGRNA